MKLYLISQKENDDYDTYDSAVVCAPDEETARNMNPAGGGPMDWKDRNWGWCNKPESVEVEYLGEAAETVKQGIVCASYNAG